MFNPGKKHYDFLEQAADNQSATHLAPEDIPQVDLNYMVEAGLLIEYFNQGSRTRYAITGGGVAALANRPHSDFKKTNGKVEDLDLIDLKTKEAIKFVEGRGYDEGSAIRVVAEWGVEHILESKREVTKREGRA